MQPVFDKVIAGFDITAVTPPAPEKQATAPKAPCITDQDTRLAWFEARLRPEPAPEVAPGAPGDKNQQKLIEAAQSYAKGMTFASQGAWAEAQSAFRDAEKKNDKSDAYAFATAWAYLKIHKPSDAMKRYQDRYKNDPANAKALAGMIASYEESQNYREAVKLWKRYATLPAAAVDRADVQAMLTGAQELFAARYEIAENPAGGAANLASPADELEWGRSYAKELAESGVPLVTDAEVLSYVEAMCQNLVDHSKLFPTNYQLFVLDSATVNAMTVPGFIFVYRGILDASETEAALAGVLAHEIGHSVAHHTAKKVTKNYQDQKQLENLQKSSSKLSQFLARMLAGGNPLGALSFSRDAEAQADRLAVHIAFDSGFSPTGINELFQKFEQMSPSSRNSWDLMIRTHPFSIDRINTVKEYAALLPDRPTKTTSPAFERMKKRLSALPPPPDATGMMKAPSEAPARTGAAAKMKTVPFDKAPAPFSGEIPEGWTFTKKSGTYAIVSAPAGTPYFEMSMSI
jgi:predicted Zn-dependent protease